MNAAKQAQVDAVTAKLAGQPSDGYMVPAPRQWWKKALLRLFPRAFARIPDGGLYMKTYVDIRFDWKDRLRVLVSGHVVVETITETDVQVGSCKSRSAISVLGPGERL